MKWEVSQRARSPKWQSISAFTSGSSATELDLQRPLTRDFIALGSTQTFRILRSLQSYHVISSDCHIILLIMLSRPKTHSIPTLPLVPACQGSDWKLWASH